MFDYDAMKKAAAGATSGPLIAAGDRSIMQCSRGGRMLGRAHLLGNGHSTDEAMANARLWAMAPDMAAEIERLRASLGNVLDHAEALLDLAVNDDQDDFAECDQEYLCGDRRCECGCLVMKRATFEAARAALNPDPETRDA